MSPIVDAHPDAEAARPATPLPSHVAPDLSHSLNCSSVAPEAQHRERLRDKRVLFVMGSYQGKCALYRRARELGVRMTVLDGPGHWVTSAPDLFERVITVDLSDGATLLEQSLAAISAIDEPFDAVATFEEFAGPLAARIAHHLGLPGHTPHAVDLARSKLRTREVCRAAGISTPRFAPIASLADLEAAAAFVGFPAVLKPVAGASSHAVYKVNTSAELHAAYTHNIAEARSECAPAVNSDNEAALVWGGRAEMVLEEFLDGEEFDVDCLLSGGKLVYAKLARDLPQPYMVETGMQLPPNYPDDRQGALVALAEQVLRTMGFRDGVFHIEVKDTAQGPRLIEVNARLGGGPAWELHTQVWGVDLVEQYLMLQLGIPIDPTPAPAPQAFFLTSDLPAPVTGTVTNDRFLDHLAEHPHVVRAYTKVAVGQVVVGPDTGVPEWLGEIVVRGESIAHAEAIMADILASLELPIAPSTGLPTR